MFTNIQYMKIFLFNIIFICLTINSFAQTNEVVIKGTISFISSQNVYVKFDNTEGMATGDTLFVARNNILIPALTINNISSVSCVGTPIGQISLLISTPLFGKSRGVKKIEEPISKESKESLSANDQAISSIPSVKSAPK